MLGARISVTQVPSLGDTLKVADPDLVPRNKTRHFGIKGFRIESSRAETRALYLFCGARSISEILCVQKTGHQTGG